MLEGDEKTEQYYSHFHHINQSARSVL